MKNIQKCEQFYNKNQFIIFGNGSITFQSYNSIIANIDNDDLILFSDWDYSNTTRKHLYLFLDEYIYSLPQEQKAAIRQALNSSNKRQAIQKLIDEKVIQYSNEY